MPRLRDLGAAPGRMPVGRLNAITDVPGVKVGHVTLVSGEEKLKEGQGPIRTGVTAVLPHGDNLFQHKVPAAVYAINGFGKAIGLEQIREMGAIETPILLTNTLNIGRAADAAIAYMLHQNPDIGLTAGTVCPVVGENNDGFLNDIRGRHVHEEHVWQAIENANDGLVAEGNVGGGTGTACYQFKGGIGTSSRLVVPGEDDDHPSYTVGALVQTNFGRRAELMIMGAPIGQHFLESHLPEPGGGSVMIVLATDAPLDSRQLTRLAKRAALGLARTGTICSNGSGDFVIAFSTANQMLHYAPSVVESIQRLDDYKIIDRFFLAVAEAVEESVYNALVAAETMTGRDGNTLHAIPRDTLRDLLVHYRRIED